MFFQTRMENAKQEQGNSITQMFDRLKVSYQSEMKFMFYSRYDFKKQMYKHLYPMKLFYSN